MEKDERKRELQLLGVHDLRYISRKYGIKCPTMKKKEELIEELLPIICGEVEAKEPSNRGRHAKHGISSIEKLSSTTLPTEMQNIILRRESFLNNDNQNNMILRQHIDSELSSFHDKEGYLRCENNTYYFVDKNGKDVVYVPSEIAEHFYLEEGDFLVALCETNFDQQAFVVSEIEALNGYEPFPDKRRLGDFLDVIIKDSPIQSGEIIEGQQTLALNDVQHKFLEKYQSSILDFYNEGFKIVYVAVSIPIMQREKVRTIFHADCLTSLLDQEPLYAFEAINNAINNVIVRARSGEKVLMLIEDIDRIVKELDIHFMSSGEEYFEHCFSTRKLFRRLLGLNRTISNGGSVSILVSTTEDRLQL